MKFIILLTIGFFHVCAFSDMNPLKWNDSVKMFIYQHENFCSNKDISYELSDAGETQQYDDIPVFSPCNLSKRDILNIYKIAQVEDMDGEPNV